MQQQENGFDEQKKELWKIAPGRFIDPETGLPPINDSSDESPPPRFTRRTKPSSVEPEQPEQHEEPEPSKKSWREKLRERTKSEVEYAASMKGISEEERILAAFEDEWKRMKLRQPLQPLPKIKFPVTHYIPNDIVIPNPFGIYSHKEKLGYYDPEKPLILAYGKNIEMRVSGRKLNVKDQDVFIALTEMAKNKGVLEFETSVTQLCGRLGKLYGKNSKTSISKSLERLAWAEIKIVQTDGPEKGRWIISHMVSQAAGDGDRIYVSLGSFFERLFGGWGSKLLTSIESQFRLALKGDVAKQAYLFYRRQISAGHKGSYNIGLKKFCDYIGLDRKGKQSWPQKRYQVKKAHEELMRLKFFNSYKYDPSKDLIIVTFKSDKDKGED